MLKGSLEIMPQNLSLGPFLMGMFKSIEEEMEDLFIKVKISSRQEDYETRQKEKA